MLTPTLIALRGLWSTHLENIHEVALREGHAEPREVIEAKLYERTRNEFVKRTDGICITDCVASQTTVQRSFHHAVLPHPDQDDERQLLQ